MKGPKYPWIWLQRAKNAPQRCELNIKHVVLYVGKPVQAISDPKKIDRFGREVKKGKNMAQNGEPSRGP